jgi:peptide/nickel transport system substrate-binding protein
MRFTRREGLAASALTAGFVVTSPLSLFAAPNPIGEVDEGATPVDGGALVISISELPDTLDPHKTGAAVTSTILRNVSDPLIRKNFDGEFVPGLATEWSISEDGLTWTFKLREDVTFHDGTPFNAEALKANFDRILDPATNAVSARTAVGSMASTSVVDEFTFEFVTEEPYAPLLNNLSAALLSPVSPGAVESMGEEFGRAPVMTGPWMVAEWRTGDRIVLKRNPEYNWGPADMHEGPAHIETMTFQSIIEEASRVAAFEAGETHQVTLPAVDIQRMIDADQYSIVNYQRLGMVFVEFNIEAEPFTDVVVRRAINHAVNKEDVLGAALEEYGEPGYGFLSPSLFGYWDGIEEYSPVYDVDQAKALLAEAGWEDADGDGILEKDGVKFEFTMLNLPTDAWARAAQVVQSQLKDVGIQMEIQQMEFATLLEEAKAGKHQAEMMGYTSSDPDIAFTWFHSSNAGTGLNMSHVKDPELDRMIEEARVEMDQEKRAELYAEMQRYVVDLALWVPLWVDHYYIAFSRSLNNATFHDDGYAVYFDAWIED